MPRLTHFAINSDDVPATQAFYASVFGWTFREYGPPGFLQILDDAGDAPIGAIQPRRQLLEDRATVGFECTFGVDDVEAVRQRVLDAGGSVVMEIFEIPQVGRLLAFEDPGGNPALAMQYDRDTSAPPPSAGRVTGIGGIFFRSDDPEATRQWYATHLGLDVDDAGTNFTWRSDTDPDERGHTLWSPFASDSDYFGSADQQAMVNYRVDDLDAVLDRLRDAGVEIVGETQVEPFGRFQHVIDGDGRRIELWEPVTSEYEKIEGATTRS